MTDENIEFDYESEATGGEALQKSIEKLRKLKTELEACKTERQEYLDGWQRLRADVANQKKEVSQVFERAAQTATENVLEDILPALDAFDMAMQGEGWKEVSTSWRSGVEYIHTQLLQALEKNGVTPYGTVGDNFNAQEYEAVEELSGQGESGRVLSVRRKGYKSAGRIIRPAQVTLSA